MRGPLTCFLAAAAVATCLGAAAPATAPEPPPLTLMVGDSQTMGPVYTDPDGHTVYRYDRETATGTVACTGACTVTRKPLLAQPGTELRLPPGLAGTLGTVTRPDGPGRQVTYDGSPLYTYTGDTQPADTVGVNLDWHVIAPRDA
ncbi:hypothetical protein ABZ865_22005 [Streptomyces sp. NPDC047085]|uniref:COG4315 family predicted lipoprotein n=1 Tax=Streptomyces sp. NPDC047085 TaxID=3155140 RepID=UPI00340DAD9C